MSSSDNIQVILGDLEELQDVQAEIEKRYVEDVLELEKKYLELRAPIFRRTKDLISGALKPSGSRFNAEADSMARDQPKGIPGFWLRVFQNHPVLKDLITERDEGVLKHLVDVRLESVDKPSGLSSSLLGYTLLFKFDFDRQSPRPFSNGVLSKTYNYAPNHLRTTSRRHSSIGTEISWRNNKDWTHGPGSTFFSLFQSLSLPSEESIRNKEISAKDLRQIQDRLNEDFQLGEIITNEVLPGLADWFGEKSELLMLNRVFFSGEYRSRNSPDKSASSWEVLLVWSAEYGNAEAVRTILQDENISVDVNWRDVNGYSALDYAIGKGHDSAVNELLNNEDIDLTSCPTLLLYATAKNSRSQTVYQTLIRHSVVDAWFKEVCPDWPTEFPEGSRGRQHIIKFLFRHETLGVNVNYKGVDGYTPLLRATNIFDAAVVKLLLSRMEIDVNARDPEGRSPLLLVLDSSSWNSEHIGIVQLLLQHSDIDINSQDNYGRNALSYAAEKCYYMVVELLLQKEDVDTGVRDTDGSTPLLRAVGYNKDSPKTVRLLLQRKSLDVNARDKKGVTALFKACQFGHHNVVKELLDHGEGIDVNMCNSQDWTPLTSAAGNGYDEVVTLLLEHRDTDVNLAGAGKTALRHATQKNKHSTAQLLQKFGAK